MQAHSFLGNGFQEVIYQRAFAIELSKAGLNFKRELEVAIFYKDHVKPIRNEAGWFFNRRNSFSWIKGIGRYWWFACKPNFKLFKSI